jgi:hypothetical protein
MKYSLASSGPMTSCRHIQQFAEALLMDDVTEESGAASPLAPASPGGPRVRKVSAMSDFAPISVRVKKSV